MTEATPYGLEPARALMPHIASEALGGLQRRHHLQLAAALDVGAAALVTHDRDFARVKGLPILTRG